MVIHVNTRKSTRELRTAKNSVNLVAWIRELPGRGARSWTVRMPSPLALATYQWPPTAAKHEGILWWRSRRTSKPDLKLRTDRPVVV